MAGRRTLTKRPPNWASAWGPPRIGSSGKEGSMSNEESAVQVWKVLVNHEEQYTLRPVERSIPLGWREAGKRGTMEECAAYIKEVWTTMRP